MAQFVPTIFSDIKPEAFRKLVEDLGFVSTNDLAAFVGAKDDTMRRWLSGKKRIPKAVVMLLDLMRVHDYSIDDVYEITSEGRRS